MRHAKRTLGVLAAGLLLTIGLAACARMEATQNTTTGTLTQKEQTADGRTLITHVDVQTYQTIPDLTRASGAVLVGKVTTTGTPQNLARDPLNPAQEAPDRQMISQIYRVTVERWLKGSGAGQIEVAVPDYTVLNNGGRFKEPYAQLEVGQRYVLFLQKGAFYHGAGIPWQFKLAAGRAEAQAGAEFSGTIKELVHLSEEALLRAVQQAGSGGR